VRTINNYQGRASFGTRNCSGLGKVILTNIRKEMEWT